MRINNYSFGRIDVGGVLYTQDVIILRERVVSPWWREAGGHVFAPADLTDVIEAAPEIVVLGTGYFGRVNVPPETLEALGTSASIVETTALAVKTFNRLRSEGRDIIAALHLTC
jgi:hypothetical protein